MSIYIFLVFLSVAIAQDCNENNCPLPDCRCYSSNSPPGGIALADVPQIVVFTMDYSLNQEFRVLYDRLFNPNNTNPNDCPILGTFYIQDTGTNYNTVKEYYDRGFEIGVNSINGEIPQTAPGWIETIKAVKDKLKDEAGVNEADIVGARAPQLTPGGNNELIGIQDNNMRYEASCVTPEALTKFPYTYDFAGETAKCNSGDSATDSFPALVSALWWFRPLQGRYYPVGLRLQVPSKWQVVLPEFIFNGQKCASPQACIDVETSQDAYDILFNTFITHYEESRTPFVITLDPAWMKEGDKVLGTIQFIGYILSEAYEDVWIVSTMQMLEWMETPVTSAEAKTFAPWQC